MMFYSIGLRTLLICAIIFPACVSSAVGVTIPTVPIGNPNNAGILQPEGTFGSVGYEYEIALYEITNAQYVEFLNAVAETDTYGLFNTSMGSTTHGGITRSGLPGSYVYSVKGDAAGQGPGGSDYTYANKPVVYVSWFDALRFVNWLHNGQPTGAQDATTTEDGSYTFAGSMVVGPRNADATWVLPTENESYKAAYHMNDGLTGNYWNYATGSNAIPDNNLPSADSGNSANFRRNGTYTTGDFNYPFTDVGSYLLTPGPYGTYDQNGNAREWNETQIDDSSRGVSGASYPEEFPDLAATNRTGLVPFLENNNIGIRVALVPEPSTGMLLATGCGLILLLRRRFA